MRPHPSLLGCAHVRAVPQILVDAAPHCPDTKPTSPPNDTQETPPKDPQPNPVQPKAGPVLVTAARRWQCDMLGSTGTEGLHKRFLALTFSQRSVQMAEW